MDYTFFTLELESLLRNIPYSLNHALCGLRTAGHAGMIRWAIGTQASGH
jgi:hypothetical protein